MNAVYSGRIQRCIQLMEQQGLDVLLLTKPSNMYYLTGDGRLCSFVMITKSGLVALGVPQTDLEDVKQRAYFETIIGFENEVGMIHAINHFFRHFGIAQGTVGLEHTFLTQNMMAMLTHPHGKPAEVVPQDCTSVLSELRIIKEDEEIARIKSAAEVAAAGMKAAVGALRPGMTESQVAAEAEYAMRNAGAEEFWRSYVASGPRTNIAHGLPSNRRLETGDLVMIDLHPIVNGYSADLCRTVSVGKASPEQNEAFNLYLQAQQSTIAKAGVGVGVAELEANLHGIIKAAGFGDHIFGPPIHGVGIDFEEAPLPPGHAFFHGEKAPRPLVANTVIAVGNCGLYLGPWAVRVEDTVVIREAGAEVLTDFPRSLQLE